MQQAGAKRKAKEMRIVLKVIRMGIWRQLEASAAAPHEYTKLELPGAWEPRGSSHSSQPGEDSRAQSFVSHGNKA